MSSNDIPPYNIQLLIHNLIPQYHTTTRSSQSSHLTCAQALGSEIYIGCSDGTLLRFALQADDPRSPEKYTLLSSQSVLSNKSIDDLVLVPTLSRAIIFTDHQLLLYTIPSLDPVRSKPIRDVVHFAVDDQHLQRPYSPSDSHIDPVDICIIKQSSIALCTIRERIAVTQEFPIPSGISLARRSGHLLCVADSEFYNMIHLKSASLLPMLPIVQLPDEEYTPQPSITVIGMDEFLLLSVIGPGTIGVMVNGEGEPVRGTLEWPSHPESICLDYPHVATLLPNKTVEIRHLDSLQMIQVISPMTIYPSLSPSSPSSSPVSPPTPRILVASTFGFLVPSTQRTEKLRLTPVPLIINPPKADVDSSSSNSNSNSESPPRDNHPPDAATQSKLAHKKKQASQALIPSVFPHSNIMILSENAVQSLLPATLISQAESLLESHRIEDTVDLADQHRRKMLGMISADEDQAEELRYVYQRVGFQCFSETLFEDAGTHLLEGEMDPRLIVRFFPSLRGNLFKEDDTIDVFAGVAERLPAGGSIDEIIAANLVKNYSPYLAPNTHDAPPTAELRRILGTVAKDMLTTYLRKCRTRRLIDGSANKDAEIAKPVNEVVDTVLMKILAESENTGELYRLVDQPNDIILSEVVDTLVKNGQYNALCKLYERDGEEDRLLDAWSKIVDGIWSEMDIPSPLINMRDLLKKTSNRALVQQWSIWMLQKDVEMGIDLLISRDSKKSKPEEDAALLTRIEEANPLAGERYLEYLVLRKRSNDKDLHMKLAMSCIDQLVDAVANETTAKMWRAKSSSYASSRNESPFLLYFATTTPNSDHKRVRLKTALFLQGSNLYDVDVILERLKEHGKVLQLELAILYGKLQKHEDALNILANQVRDSTSAEAYCTLGGEVVPAKVAQSVGEQCDLRVWANLVAGSGNGEKKKKVADDETKGVLLRVLLGVYMRGGESSADRTARLLNSQAINFDVMDVISLVPPDWSLSSMSSFLTRSFRRTVHEQHEGQILKAISAGQNLEVSERTWLTLRDAGSVVEEAAEDENGGDDAGGEGGEKEKTELSEVVGDEKALTEKMVDLNVSDQPVADIVVGSSPSQKEGVHAPPTSADRGKTTL